MRTSNLVSPSRAGRGRGLGCLAATISLMLAVWTGLACAQTVIADNHPEEAATLASSPEIAPEHPLRITINIALHNRDALEKLIADQQNPSSPMYHRWLTPGEFNDRFGPTADDLATIEGWLAKAGFSVESANMSSRTLTARAPALVVEKALAVKIATSPDGNAFANLNDPIVPPQIAPLIGSIEGLSNTRHFKFNSRFEKKPNTTIGGNTAFGPTDLWTFYDKGDSMTGSGRDCIGLIEDADFENSSLDKFDTQFGLPSISPARVLADGSNPGFDFSFFGTLEADLDVQYAHGVATGAPITVYLGNENNASANGGLVDALTRAVNDDDCGTISVSFSFCGAPKTFYTGVLDPILAQADSQQQAVFISAGDDGASGLKVKNNSCVPSGVNGVSELAADPHVVAVGGTQFSPNFSNPVYTTETTWHDGKPLPPSERGATGGGVSKIFMKPSFQSGVFKRSKKRSIPDIAFAASELSPGFFIGYQGAQIQCCIGGTSLSAPAWAAVTTLAAQNQSVSRIGNPNSTLYMTLGPEGDASSSGLHDIAKGGNGLHGAPGFKAKVGFDRTTGWGTPDISILVPQL